MRYSRVIVLGCALAALAAFEAAPAIGSAATGSGSGGQSPYSQGGGSQGGGSQGGSSQSGDRTGGAGEAPGAGPSSTPQHPVVKGFRAKVIHGLAYAPSYAPVQVQRIIWAGNRIRHKPYVYGGGHGAWKASGYDCSGTVSYVLHAAGLLKSSMDSSGFMSWGQSGRGQWVTVCTNPSHAFIQVAGIRFDTSSEDDPHPPPGTGPRWRPLAHHTGAFQARHPAGF